MTTVEIIRWVCVLGAAASLARIAWLIQRDVRRAKSKAHHEMTRLPPFLPSMLGWAETHDGSYGCEMVRSQDCEFNFAVVYHHEDHWHAAFADVDNATRMVGLVERSPRDYSTAMEAFHDAIDTCCERGYVLNDGGLCAAAISLRHKRQTS